MDHVYDNKVAVVGGDQRQIAVALALSSLFRRVKVYGHSSGVLPEPLENIISLNEVIKDIQIVVLPISGMNEAGLVRGSQADRWIDFGDALLVLPAETIIVTGSLAPRWLKAASGLGLKVIEYAEDDALAILNSVPTAEGALQLAMEELPITVHGSTVLVVGFGRVAVTVARLFKAVGARVLVAARREAALARAKEMSCETLSFDSLADTAGKVDLIINTVPDLVIDELVLKNISLTTLIIDLASAPGGVDFETAKALKIKAILAPALPGKVAPKTAGMILAEAIPRLLITFLTAGGGR